MSRSILAILVLFGFPVIGIAVAYRNLCGPPFSAAEMPPKEAAAGGFLHTDKLVPIDQLRKVAIAEVKKREGWTGEAAPPSQEGNTYYFWLPRDPKKSTIGVQVGVDCVTGEITGYDRWP
jgi:hypothetical protein